MEQSKQEDANVVAELLAEPTIHDTLEDGATPQGRSWRRWFQTAALLTVLLGGSLYALKWFGIGFPSRTAQATATHVVARGDLEIIVTEEGTLESAQNLDIKCEVAGGSTLLSVIADGKEVKEGTELARLDSSKLETEISQQKITLEKARATYTQAEKDLATAKVSVTEYVEGTYPKELQEAKSKVAEKEEGLTSAENLLKHGQRMFRKGYITKQQLDAQQYAVERGHLDLSAARLAQKVLERFTHAKMLQDLKSKCEAAESKQKSEKASLELEEAKLKRMETQLAKCVIRAPKAGMVIYSNENRGWGDSDKGIKAGATVHEQQVIFRLPNLSHMQVKVGVHESKIREIREGLQATIRAQDREFQGKVTAIANQADRSWLSSVKKYSVTVEIEGKSIDLRPGMTAEVRLLVARLKDVISLPVAAVYEEGGQVFCYVRRGHEMLKHKLVLGKSNDKEVEVVEGLALGDEVVLNPRTVLGEADKKAETKDPAAKKKSDSDPKKAADSPPKADTPEKSPAPPPGKP